MRKSTKTAWTAQDGNELLTQEGVGRFYVRNFWASREKLGELRNAINDALGLNEPETSAAKPIMEPEDLERELRQRIEEQGNKINVALGYLSAGQPELASLCLGDALPERKGDK